MNRIFVGAMLFLLCISAPAKGKWKYAGTSQGNIVVYDVNSIKRRGPVISVWEKWVPIGEGNRQRRADELSLPNYAYSLEKSEYQCGKKQMRNVGTVLYDAEGRVISSSDDADTWGEIVPDSIGEVVLEAVCH